MFKLYQNSTFSDNNIGYFSVKIVSLVEWYTVFLSHLPNNLGM